MYNVYIYDCFITLMLVVWKDHNKVKDQSDIIVMRKVY